jgi:hypothetical protein
MDSNKTIHELIGRAVTDPDFRMRLFDDPEGTLAAEGYKIAPEVVEKFKALDVEAAEAAINQLDEAFAGRSAAG